MQVRYDQLTFGIEIEFTRIRRSDAATVVADYFHTTARQFGFWGHDSYEIKDQNSRVWKIIRDASIEPEMRHEGSILVTTEEWQCELVSPVLNYNDIPLVQQLVRELRAAGAGANHSTGIHVHIGAEAFTPQSLRVLCNIVYAKQDLLVKALDVNPNRRQHCMNLSEDFIRKLNRIKPTTLQKFGDCWYYGANALPARRRDRYNESRYRVCNLHNLLSGRSPTIEFRLFNSTFHAGKVKAYIQLSLKLVEMSLRAKKATSRVTVAENGNERFIFRVFLLKLGFLGDDFKSARKHLLQHLNGNSAWKDPAARETREESLVDVGT